MLIKTDYKRTATIIKASIADVKSYSYFCIQLKYKRAMGGVSEKTPNSIFDCGCNPTARFFLEVCMSNQQVLIPVSSPEKPKFFKVKNKTEGSIYLSHDKKPIKADSTDIASYFDMIIEHFKQLTNLIESSDLENPYIFIFGTLINHFSDEINILHHFIREDIGSIEVERIGNEIVGVSVKQINRKGETE